MSGGTLCCRTPAEASAGCHGNQYEHVLMGGIVYPPSFGSLASPPIRPSIHVCLSVCLSTTFSLSASVSVHPSPHLSPNNPFMSPLSLSPPGSQPAASPLTSWHSPLLPLSSSLGLPNDPLLVPLTPHTCWGRGREFTEGRSPHSPTRAFSHFSS